MPKCPNCGAELDHLDSYLAAALAHTHVDEHGNAQWVREELGEEVNTEEYVCPYCGKSLFHTEADAIAFLRGEQPELVNWTVYLMTPYAAWEGIPARTADEAIAQCHYPWEFDCNEPHHWIAVPEEGEEI